MSQLPKCWCGKPARSRAGIEHLANPQSPSGKEFGPRCFDHDFPRWMRAVLVLDAWAAAHDEAVSPVPVFHAHMGPGPSSEAVGTWTISVPTKAPQVLRCPSAMEARCLAADALMAEDPTLEDRLWKADIG